MALRFLDSFDHYATADLTAKWNVRTGTNNAVQSAGGRRGTNSWRITQISAPQHLTRTFDAQSTWILGFAFQTASLPNSTAEICMLLDAGTNQVELRLLTDGTLRVTRNNTTLGTSVNAISAGVNYYIEFKATIDDATGSYEVRVNGSSWISGSNVDTKNTANASANQARFGHTLSVAQVYNIDYDDLYICDGTGGAQNDFLGDTRVDAYLPNANGNSSQLTGSDGNSADNYLLVDEASANGDTDYVASSTTGHKDTYGFADMAHDPPAIHGVQLNYWARKDDAGARSLTPVIRSGGSDTDLAMQAVGTTYADYLAIRTTDPSTSAAWTRSGFNAAEFGAKVA